MPQLYIFSGLPAAGKTTLAKRLSRHLRAAYVRIDTIEQALRDLADIDVQAEGYELAYRITADSLQMGVDVVADSCNPIELTRRAWREVAARAGSGYQDIEVICSDPVEHRWRAETRPSTVEGLTLPTWVEITQREYDPWHDERIIIDTAGSSEDEAFAELVKKLGHSRAG